MIQFSLFSVVKVTNSFVSDGVAFFVFHQRLKKQDKFVFPSMMLFLPECPLYPAIEAPCQEKFFPRYFLIVSRQPCLLD